MVADLQIDCGSDLTLINIETFNSIPESARPWLQETQVRLSTASGSALIIPPQHEVRLVGMLDRPQANSVLVKQGLLKPTASLVEETGLFMGNSLVDTSGPLVPVTLLNLQSWPN